MESARGAEPTPSPAARRHILGGAGTGTGLSPGSAFAPLEAKMTASSPAATLFPGTSADRRSTMQRLGLLWRGLRWRIGTSALVLLVATVGIFAATVGPLFLGTADGTVLHGTLNGEGPGQNSVTALAMVESQQSQSAARRALVQERASSMRGGYGPGLL